MKERRERRKKSGCVSEFPRGLTYYLKLNRRGVQICAICSSNAQNQSTPIRRIGKAVSQACGITLSDLLQRPRVTTHFMQFIPGVRSPFPFRSVHTACHSLLGKYHWRANAMIIEELYNSRKLWFAYSLWYAKRLNEPGDAFINPISCWQSSCKYTLQSLHLGRTLRKGRLRVSPVGVADIRLGPI